MNFGFSESKRPGLAISVGEAMQFRGWEGQGFLVCVESMGAFGAGLRYDTKHGTCVTWLKKGLVQEHESVSRGHS